MGGFGLLKRRRCSCEGNGAVLVVVNSIGSYWDYSIVEDTILVALEHFGVPYRLVDVAKEPLTKEKLASGAGIILAQSRLGAFLTPKIQGEIVAQVRQGMGLVNFDEDIRNYSREFLDIFGFEHINPHPYVTRMLRARQNEHYITQLQDDGECHELDRMTTAIAVEKWGDTVIPLAEGILSKDELIYIRHVTPWSAYEPRNYPCVFAVQYGKGKAVQFTISSRIWKRGFLGHMRGIDDLFFRSILWTVKKPFITNEILPFVAMSFDDCSGRYGFRYADIAAEYGYIPLPSLFLDRVDSRLYPKIAADQRSGKIEYNTHAFSYHEQLYHAYGKGRYSEEKLREIFEREDTFWSKVGVEPIKTVRFHCGEMGVNALPYLKRRGRTFINPAFQTGILKAEMDMDDGYWPYNLQNCCYDYLPDDHDFYLFFSSLARHKEDFLTGCTVNLMENLTNDLDRAARNLEANINLGLRSGFYAEILTHEQKFENLRLEQWEEILKKASALTAKYQKVYAGHDAIGMYLKAKDAVFFAEVSTAGEKIAFAVRGDPAVPLRFSVYKEENGQLYREHINVPVFEKQYRAVEK